MVEIKKVEYFVLAASYFPRESIIASTELNFRVRNELKQYLHIVSETEREGASRGQAKFQQKFMRDRW